MSNKKKIVIGLGVIVISLISSILYYKFYYLKYIAPYRFWNDFIAKDKKPLFVSLKEYQDKNEQGFCWRDKRFYTKEELKEKAMKSLLKKLSYGMDIYRSGKNVYGASDQFEIENKWYCSKKNKENNGQYCLVLGINGGEMTNKEFIDLINDEPLNDYKVFKGSTYWKTYTNESDVDKNDFDFKKNIVFFEKRLNEHNFYGSDCCNVIDKNEFKKLSDYRLLSDYRFFYSHIVMSLSINPLRTNKVIAADVRKNELNPKYGNSNFYLNVHYVFQPHARIRNDIFVMNNCGDILYAPYF